MLSILALCSELNFIKVLKAYYAIFSVLLSIQFAKMSSEVIVGQITTTEVESSQLEK